MQPTLKPLHLEDWLFYKISRKYDSSKCSFYDTVLFNLCCGQCLTNITPVISGFDRISFTMTILGYKELI